MKKTKWIVLAGLALALPASGVLSGCSGGNSGGGGLTVFGNNPFAGVQGTGQLLDANNLPVGNVTLVVGNNGALTGTLTAALIAGNAVHANTPRATVTNGTGTVGSDGNYVLTFDVRTTGNVNGIVTFRGRLIQNGNVISAQDTIFESPFAGFSGTYGLSITTVIPGGGGGGGGNANATFNFANAVGTNATTSTFNATRAVTTVIRNGSNQVTQVTSTFYVETGSPLRTLTVTVGDGFTVVAPGNFTSGNGAIVAYTETNVSNQQTRLWNSGSTGTIRLDSLSATEAQVTVTGVSMSPLAIPNAPDPATGTFSLSGTGTSTIQ